MQTCRTQNSYTIVSVVDANAARSLARSLACSHLPERLVSSAAALALGLARVQCHCQRLLASSFEPATSESGSQLSLSLSLFLRDLLAPQLSQVRTRGQEQQVGATGKASSAEAALHSIQHVAPMRACAAHSDLPVRTASARSGPISELVARMQRLANCVIPFGERLAASFVLIESSPQVTQVDGSPSIRACSQCAAAAAQLSRSVEHLLPHLWPASFYAVRLSASQCCRLHPAASES